MREFSGRTTTLCVNPPGHLSDYLPGKEDIAMQQVNRELVRSRHADRREYQALMALSVTCFLIVSVVTRVLPRGLRPLAAGSGDRESCLKEARRAARACVPYAFEW